jgi:hypothetical protein
MLGEFVHSVTVCYLIVGPLGRDKHGAADIIEIT